MFISRSGFSWGFSSLSTGAQILRRRFREFFGLSICQSRSGKAKICPMEIICDQCRQREARVFSTHIGLLNLDEIGEIPLDLQGRSRETTQRNLCFACYDIEHPGKRKAMENRRCQYCGWKAGNDFCQPCMREMQRFLRRGGLDLPVSQWTPEQIAQSVPIFMELEPHMKKWGAERRRRES